MFNIKHDALIRSHCRANLVWHTLLATLACADGSQMVQHGHMVARLAAHNERNYIRYNTQNKDITETI